MTLNAVYRQAAAERAAPADLDRVADRDFARGLAYDAPVNALATLAQQLCDAARAIDRGALFIAGDQKGDRAAVARMRAHELLGRGQHRRKSALHVRSPSSVEHSIADFGHEGIAAPRLQRAGRYDVGVSGEAEHRWRTPAARPEILDVSEGQWLDAEAGGCQALAHQLLATFVGGRHGTAAEQIPSEFNGL